MPQQSTAGSVQLCIEIPAALNARLAAWLEATGHKKTAEVIFAITRHLDHPPPPAITPGFPEAGNGNGAPVPLKRGRGRPRKDGK